MAELISISAQDELAADQTIDSRLSDVRAILLASRELVQNSAAAFKCTPMRERPVRFPELPATLTMQDAAQIWELEQTTAVAVLRALVTANFLEETSPGVFVVVGPRGSKRDPAAKP